MGKQISYMTLIGVHLNHASRAHQLMSKKKNTMCVSMCVHVHEIVCTYSTDIVHARNRIVDFALCNLPFQTFL